MAEKVLMFALSPTMEAGTIVKWNKKEGENILHNEPICEVETDKSSMEYESMNEGVLLKIIVAEGQSAVVGQPIAIVGKKGEDISAILAELKSVKAPEPKHGAENQILTHAQPETQVPANAATNLNAEPSHTGSRIKISPLAKKIAEDSGVEISSIKGSGPGGRIVKKDIAGVGANSGSGVSMAVVAASGTDIITPVKGVRAVIAQRLSESKFTAPHFYVKNEINTDVMMELRSQCNQGLKEKLSLNAFIIKFVAEAIKQNPAMNSSWQGANIIQYASIDIGLAVDLGNGLFTPIVRNCGNKGIHLIDKELKVLIDKVRNKTIAAEEYNGATFTISNLGSFGVDEFSAIINPPGAAILAIGRSRKVPIVNDKGAIEVGSLMTVTLSSDHRVIDGSLAGRFISTLQRIIEMPGSALL